MTTQNLLNTMLSRLDAMPEDKRETLIAHMLKRIEADALEDKRQRDAARRRAAMLAKYPFLDGEYVASVEFDSNGFLRSVDLRVHEDSFVVFELSPLPTGNWRMNERWEGGVESDNWLATIDVAKCYGELFALMRRVVDEVGISERVK